MNDKKKCNCTVAKTGHKCQNNGKYLVNGCLYCGLHKECKSPWGELVIKSPPPAKPVRQSPPAPFVIKPQIIDLNKICNCHVGKKGIRCPNKSINNTPYCGKHKHCKFQWVGPAVSGSPFKKVKPASLKIPEMSPIKAQRSKALSPVRLHVKEARIITKRKERCNCHIGKKGERCPNKPINNTLYCGKHKNCKNVWSGKEESGVDKILKGGAHNDIAYVKNMYENKCAMPAYKNFNQYKNDELGIDVIGMAQVIDDQDKVDTCIKMLVESDVIYYITFNKQGNYIKLTDEEQIDFKKYCNRINCNFYSLPVQDYKPPTVEIIKELWKILDNFNAIKKTNPNVKLVMHCTASFGRTGTMIMSYIIYKILNHYSADIRAMLKANLEDDLKGDDLPEIIKNIKNNELIQFIRSELRNKYNKHAEKEIFEDGIEYPEKQILLILRLKNILSSY